MAKRSRQYLLPRDFSLTLTAALTAAVLLMIGGCGRPPAPPAGAAPSPPAEMTLQDFASRRGLHIVSASPERAILEKPGLRLILSADLPYCSVNGRLCLLQRPAFLANGGLWVPAVEIDEYLPALAPSDRPETPMRRLVILDPGHGGHDAGAVANGLREKDVVLDVARQAAAKLRGQGLRVILTRDSDRYLPLEQRSEIANREPGAVFVSIHVNAAGNSSRGAAASGVETFVLTSRISESYRVQRAATKYDLPAVNGGATSEISAIAKLSQEARRESYRLATAIQRHLVSALGENDRKVQGKNLAVLRENYFGPAVLTEIGFLTNPHTARRLASPSYRQNIGAAIADGILAYLRQR